MVRKMVQNRLAHLVIQQLHNHNISPNSNKQMPLDNVVPCDLNQDREALLRDAQSINNN